MRDNGPLPVNSNFTTSTLKTHSDVDGGVFVTVNGAGDADGGFAVIGVPKGPYYLQYGSAFVLTPHDTLDLSTRYMGRPGQKLAPSPTQLTINAVGLSPWDANTILGMSSTNLGVSVESITHLGATEPAAGATSAQLTFNYAQGDMKGLVEAAAGDTLVLTQNQRFLSPSAYWASMASATITGLTQIGGQSSVANAVFAPLPMTTVPIDWRVTQFEAFRSTVNASATVTSHQLVVRAVAGQSAIGVQGGTHALLYMTAPSGSPDLTGSAQFGNPFANTLELNAGYSVIFAVMVQAPGATAAPLTVGINHTVPLSTAVGPMLPGLSPPRNITLNGMPTTAPLSGVGTTPLISWTPPALGTPDRYVVTVHRLTNVAGQTQITAVATVRLKGSRARIPPGVLVAGTTYAISVAAWLSGNVDSELQPFTTGRTLDYADAVIGQLTP